jgi:hypothetical protein
MEEERRRGVMVRSLTGKKQLTVVSFRLVREKEPGLAAEVVASLSLWSR